MILLSKYNTSQGFQTQEQGLIQRRVDASLIYTCQDIVNLKLLVKQGCNKAR